MNGYLTHFKLVLRTQKKPIGFLIFWGDMEMEYWLKIGQGKLP